MRAVSPQIASSSKVITLVKSNFAKAALALLAAATLFTVSAPARADGSMNLQVDWFRTAERGARKVGLWRDGSKEGSVSSLQRGPLATDFNGYNGYNGSNASMWRRHSDATVSSALRLDVPQMNTPLFGVAPEVSLIARDWGGAKSLVGGEIAVTDAIRPSHSFRMALARFRLGSGRITPFTQLGFGSYRIDNDVVKTTMRDTEVAAQVGGGIEIHVIRNAKVQWDMAFETSLTQLVRNEREPQNVAMTRMFSSVLASRVRF